MKFNCNFVKVFAVLLFTFAAINLGLSGLDQTVNYSEFERPNFTCSHIQETNIPAELFLTPQISDSNNFLGYLFQIMFILFFISPPIIATMLFLIWGELKKKNKLK